MHIARHPAKCPKEEPSKLLILLDVNCDVRHDRMAVPFISHVIQLVVNSCTIKPDAVEASPPSGGMRHSIGRSLTLSAGAASPVPFH